MAKTWPLVAIRDYQYYLLNIKLYGLMLIFKWGLNICHNILCKSSQEQDMNESQVVVTLAPWQRGINKPVNTRAGQYLIHSVN